MPNESSRPPASSAVAAGPTAPGSPVPGLPLAALLALACAVFVAIVTEALPAGLLPEIAGGLDCSESQAGLLVTVYAIGSALTAIPLTAATRGVARKPLLLAAIAVFAVGNLVTAVSPIYAITLVGRFFGGVAAGVLWAMAAGYAMRLVPPAQKGRALAVAMAGAPVALAFGIPAGTLLGQLVGWRATFVVLSGLTAVLVVWVVRAVPPFPGETTTEQVPLRRVAAHPGLVGVLVCTLALVLAHNALYTYIAPYLEQTGLRGRVTPVLLVFGCVSLVSLWLVGILVDRRMRQVVLGATSIFVVAVVVLGVAGRSPLLVLAGVVLWALAFGGAATFLQASAANAAGPQADVAQSMVVTVWNVAMAAGALLGGVVLDGAGARTLPWLALTAIVISLLVTVRSGRTAFASPAVGVEAG